MSKRSRDDAPEDAEPQQKKRKGFSVGPANLPDGTYRRKTQKIKNDLIQKAKVKKAYAKIKANDESEPPTYDPYAAAGSDEHVGEIVNGEAVGIHPERKAMLEGPEMEAEEESRSRARPRQRQRRGQDTTEDVNGFRERNRKERYPKPSRYQKEFAQAEALRARMEQKRLAGEARDRERKAMAKARKPGKDGKVKLGRQGSVLLSKVKRMVDEGKV